VASAIGGEKRFPRRGSGWKGVGSRGTKPRRGVLSGTKILLGEKEKEKTKGEGYFREVGSTKGKTSGKKRPEKVWLRPDRMERGKFGEKRKEKRVRPGDLRGRREKRKPTRGSPPWREGSPKKSAVAGGSNRVGRKKAERREGWKKTNRGKKEKGSQARPRRKGRGGGVLIPVRRDGLRKSRKALGLRRARAEREDSEERVSKA